ncbi:unnamed protein product, partial [Staurois parvus]
MFSYVSIYTSSFTVVYRQLSLKSFFEHRKLAFRSRFYHGFKCQMLINVANRVYKRLCLKFFFSTLPFLDAVQSLFSSRKMHAKRFPSAQIDLVHHTLRFRMKENMLD